MPFPSSTRVFVSPYARSLLAEQGRSAAGIQGTGYSGAVTSRDVIAAGGGATTAAPSATTGSFTELPLTGMRKVGWMERGMGGSRGSGILTIIIIKLAEKPAEGGLHCYGASSTAALRRHSDDCAFMTEP